MLKQSWWWKAVTWRKKLFRDQRSSTQPFGYTYQHHRFASSQGSYARHHQTSAFQKSKSLFPSFSRWIVLSWLLLPIIAAALWLYLNVFSSMPRISSIQEKWFSQATVITDRNGEVLYRLYDENREYVEFDKISPNFVNAIIAVEDQRFWTNAGIDIFGIVRAAIRDITKGDSHGASTITQQLIKNMLLTSEKKISRKLKEVFLAMQINDFIADDIRKKHKNLSQKETDRKVKEKIFELYANYIFFGNNAYGIETAAKTYFWVSAKDLDLTQSAILASLPKAPSKYDPYTNKEQLVWSLLLVSTEEQDQSNDAKGQVYGKIETELQKAKLQGKDDEIEILRYIWGLLNFSYQVSGTNYDISYSPGRKDIVLARMFVDELVTEKQFKDAIFDWLTIHFNRSKTNIVAPHFVFWVINQLEQQFDSEVLRKWWLQIKTSLDLSIQKLAEEAIQENDKAALAYGASNSAMLYVDSQQGDVLAYVWSKDYYNKDIGWENDLVQRPRQPWSTIKPLLYAFGFMKIAMGIDSPIYDLPMTIAGNKPENVDGKFNGLMSIKTALASSRNIPAIKMFLMVWGENPLKEFLTSLWVTSLEMNKEIYGYPLAIGAWEIPMMQMVKAYTHLSAWGKPAVINPILEITNPQRDILYKKKVEKAEEVVPLGVANLLWKILSDMDNMPAWWRKTFDFPAVKFATKSWTTNGVYGDKKLPRDGWFVAYTPSKVMMFWWGNNDGKPLKETAYGWWLNAPVWRSFSNKLVKNKYISNDSMDDADIKKIALSRLSGKLASNTTPLAFIVNSLAYIGNSPSAYDGGWKTLSLDTLCWWGVAEGSGVSNRAYVIAPSSIMPDKRDQNDIIAWRAWWWLRSFQWGPYYLSEKNIDCASLWIISTGSSWLWWWQQGSWVLSLSITQPVAGQQVSRSFSVWHQTKWPNAIQSISLYLNEVEVKTMQYQDKNVIDLVKVNIPESLAVGNYTLKLIAKDEKGQTDTKSVPVVLIEKDTTVPVLLTDKIRIEKVEIVKASGTGDVGSWSVTTQYKVTLLFSDAESSIKQGSLWQGWQQIASFSSNVVTVQVASLADMSYVVVDSSDNKGSGMVPLAQ
jgi:penicillin-binding protein 1A